MHAHPVPIHRPIENDSSILLDEEFDTFEIRYPFNRQPDKDRATLLCADEGWDD